LAGKLIVRRSKSGRNQTAGDPTINPLFAYYFPLLPANGKLLKLDVIGSIPIARSNISFNAFRQSLAEAARTIFRFTNYAPKVDN
jgi:hypothetical protein